MAEFIITTDYEGRHAKVTFCQDDEPAVRDWMMAAESLLCVAASRSPDGFEKGMELICAGACTYRKKPGQRGTHDD